MSGKRIVFLDRDGTLNEETSDEKIDSLEKIRFMPGVFAALQALKSAGFGFVMVTNQDGLGTPELPNDRFDPAHRFILNAFSSQGIEFDEVFICPHFLRENCDCRKPKIGMVRDYLAANALDLAHSYMVGDRDTDLQFAANLGLPGMRVRQGGTPEETWPVIAARILGSARRARVQRKTKETDIDVEVDLSREGPNEISTGLGFFDHMLEQIAKHGGFALRLKCSGDLRSRRAPHRRGLRARLGRRAARCARPKARHCTLRVLAADGRVRSAGGSRSFGPAVLRLGWPLQSRTGRRAADRTRAAFLPLARRVTGRGAPPQRARRERASHDRGLLQGSRPQPAPGGAHRGDRVAEHEGPAVRPVEVVIIESGGANIASLQYALERLGISARLSADAERIRGATHVILPGVGAAANAMQRLRAAALDSVIPQLTQPVLGICLGMQLLHASSAEGSTCCLGIIPGHAERFNEAPGLPVPHIGWNTIAIDAQNALLEGLVDGDYAYFVHSFALPETSATIATTVYGRSFSACVQWRNFFGAQFHPERSAAVGARLLQNFVNLQ